VFEHAQETLRNYYQEARKGKDAESRGSVVFSDIVGVDDSWLLEN